MHDKVEKVLLEGHRDRDNPVKRGTPALIFREMVEDGRLPFKISYVIFKAGENHGVMIRFEPSVFVAVIYFVEVTYWSPASLFDELA